MSQLIKCPHCGSNNSIVKDSRTSPNENEVRRRRVCSNGHKFTTYEITEQDLSHARAIKRMLGGLSREIRGLLKTRVFTSPASAPMINSGSEKED